MYIKETVAISPQNTIQGSFFENDALEILGIKYNAIEPNYKEFIPVSVLRRMGKAVRMAIGAGLPILNNHKNIEAIIIGTAHGGMEDSIKFLNQIISYEEGTLTPTNFVQSTPNAIAGGLAQMSKCYGYNNTHTNDGLSFEGALQDAMLLLNNKEVNALLLGAIEEISEYNYNLEFLQGRFKEDESISSLNLLKTDTPGTVAGEGATMFFIENSAENALAKIEDLDTFCFPSETELQENLDLFLAKNNLKATDIDVLVSGRSGDNRQNKYYDIIESNFAEANIYTYKNLVGEYPTSSAFAVWLACEILQGKNIPKQALFQNKNRTNKTLLVYNQHKNKQHSFVLMTK